MDMIPRYYHVDKQGYPVFNHKPTNEPINPPFWNQSINQLKHWLNRFDICHVTMILGVIFHEIMTDPPVIFPFREEMDPIHQTIRVGRWIDGRTDGWMDWWADGWIDGWMDGWMDDIIEEGIETDNIWEMYLLIRKSNFLHGFLANLSPDEVLMLLQVIRTWHPLNYA